MSETSQAQSLPQPTQIVEKVTIKQMDNPQEYGRVIAAIRKSKEKITRDIEINALEELVIRNTAELIAIRAIRNKKNKEKITKTQRVMNKFKNLV